MLMSNFRIFILRIILHWQRLKRRVLIRPSKMSASSDDYSDWMGALPEELQKRPLNSLALPGSHDTAAYSLDPKSEIGPDENRFIHDLVKLFGDLARKIIYNWSVTQSLTMSQQLMAGIRYLDLRVAYRESRADFYLLHALYGMSVKECLQDINTFLTAHPKEVVLLDFNHLYAMTPDRHEKLLTMIEDVFGNKLCPLLDMESVTLSNMWDNNLQVIVFYHDAIVKDKHQFWPSDMIPSPYPDTDNVDKSLAFLNTNYDNGHSADKFYVWQGVLTPTIGLIVANITKTLKNSLVPKIGPPYVNWVSQKTASATQINVCLLDFVEMFNFIPTVIALNKTSI